MPERSDRICHSCGRRIEWRKKWERDWENVRYCSGRCRTTGVSVTDLALEEAILSLLDQRSRTATVCPSEAARAVEPERWQTLMEPARRAARRLAARELVEITQKARPVDPSMFKGPIRIRRLETL
jgi:hypothetical protein